MSLVVDASVALKWFLSEEPLANQALAVVQDGAALIAPDFLIAEVCNAAWRSARLGRISQVQVVEIATSLPRAFDAFFSGAGLAPRAVAIAGQLDHPVYDCLYLALAEAEQARFVTAASTSYAPPRGSRGRSVWRNTRQPIVPEVFQTTEGPAPERWRAIGSHRERSITIARASSRGAISARARTRRDL